MHYIIRRTSAVRTLVQIFCAVLILATSAATFARAAEGDVVTPAVLGEEVTTPAVDTTVAEEASETPSDDETVTDEESTDADQTEEATEDSTEETTPETQGLRVTLPDTDDKKELAPCVDTAASVNEVISSAQGTLNNDNAITDPTRTDDQAAIGAADGVFFSLGKSGTIKTSFAGYLMDVPGNDLSLHEITNGRDTYPEEAAKVEVSQNGVDFVTVGTAKSTDGTGVSSFDIASTGFTWITIVRVTDMTNFSLQDATADGYDLDAIDATYQSCILVDPYKEATYNSATGTLHYDIYWEVLGSGEADVTITDVLPTGITYVDGSADNGGVYTGGTRTLVWALGTHGAGDSGHVTFDATLDAAVALSSWAKTVVSFAQGKQANLTTSIDANRSDANQVLGVAQTAGSIYDNPLPDYIGKFVSLGFSDGSTGGQIVVAFDHPVVNGAGNDLQIFEVTSGDVYPDEQIQVSVSNDNSTWTNVGVVVRDGGVDLGAASEASYVRITETSDKANFEPAADGFDVDAIKDLHTPLPQICDVVNTAEVSWPVLVGDDTVIVSLPASTTTIINEEVCSDETYSISGHKWNDADGNATKDGDEAGVAGITIYNDANDNGVKDGSEASAVTDASGNYTLSGLTPGLYIVREVVPAGSTQTYPTAVSFGKHVVFVTSFNITGKDFGNKVTGGGSGGDGGSGGSGGSGPTGSITGVVFNDANNNGVFDEGESQLSGWVAFLDTNDNGILDGGEVSKTTASPYLFSGLADGSYTVREVVQSGWTQTLPTAGNSFKYVVVISGGNAVTDKNFGNFQTPGGNGGSGSTQGTTSVGSGGGSIPTPTVLGNSTNTPSPDAGSGLGGAAPTPVVLGATELPRTGNSASVVMLALMLGAGAALALRKFRQAL